MASRLTLSLLLLLVTCAMHLVPVQGISSVATERRAFFSGGSYVLKPVDHPIVQDAARFAVGELQKLSDSGIYKTLQLEQIHSAAAEVGDFHYSVHLQLSLASPHFQSGNGTENFELMVLESKDLPGRQSRGERSIAIDEFPVMDEDAIELFWIDMVEARRRKRTALFDRWRREAQQGIDPVVAAAAEVAMAVQQMPLRPKIKVSIASDEKVQQVKMDTSAKSEKNKKKTKTLTLEDLVAMSTKHLRKLLTATTGVSDELREAVTEIIDARLDRLEREERTQEGEKDEL